MEDQQISYKIKYKEGMTMEAVVNAINKANENIVKTVRAEIKYQAEITIKLIDERVNGLEADMDKIKKHFKIE